MIVTLLRKPLEGSVAENTLKHGCGAINIDGTRVGTEARTYKGAGKTDKVYSESGAGMLDGRGKEMEFSVEGRWPANFILSHLEGCELRGTKKVKGHKGYPNGPGGIWSKKYQEEHQKDRRLTDVKTIKDNEAWVGHADEDGNEEVADWACVEGCPVQELDRQSGHLKSGEMKGSYQMWGRNGIYSGANEHPANTYGDEGGASRFFKQFKKEDEK